MKLLTLKPRVATLDSRRARPEPKRADRFYSTPEWREARALSLALNLWRCAACDRRDVRLYVDHKVELKDGGDPLAQSNLEPLCGACHSAKTAKHRAERMKG